MSAILVISLHEKYEVWLVSVCVELRVSYAECVRLESHGLKRTLLDPMNTADCHNFSIFGESNLHTLITVVIEVAVDVAVDLAVAVVFAIALFTPSQ